MLTIYRWNKKKIGSWKWNDVLIDIDFVTISTALFASGESRKKKEEKKWCISWEWWEHQRFLSPVKTDKKRFQRVWRAIPEDAGPLCPVRTTRDHLSPLGRARVNCSCFFLIDVGSCVPHANTSFIHSFVRLSLFGKSGNPPRCPPPPTTTTTSLLPTFIWVLRGPTMTVHGSLDPINKNS
jgi:hypothetical protein